MRRDVDAIVRSSGGGGGSLSGGGTPQRSVVQHRYVAPAGSDRRSALALSPASSRQLDDVQALLDAMPAGASPPAELGAAAHAPPQRHRRAGGTGGPGGGGGGGAWRTLRPDGSPSPARSAPARSAARRGPSACPAAAGGVAAASAEAEALRARQYEADAGRLLRENQALRAALGERDGAIRELRTESGSLRNALERYKAKRYSQSDEAGRILQSQLVESEARHAREVGELRALMEAQQLELEEFAELSGSGGGDSGYRRGLKAAGGQLSQMDGRLQGLQQRERELDAALRELDATLREEREEGASTRRLLDLRSAEATQLRSALDDIEGTAKDAEAAAGRQYRDQVTALELKLDLTLGRAEASDAAVHGAERELECTRGVLAEAAAFRDELLVHAKAESRAVGTMHATRNLLATATAELEAIALVARQLSSRGAPDMAALLDGGGDLHTAPPLAREAQPGSEVLAIATQQELLQLRSNVAQLRDVLLDSAAESFGTAAGCDVQ